MLTPAEELVEVPRAGYAAPAAILALYAALAMEQFVADNYAVVGIRGRGHLLQRQQPVDTPVPDFQAKLNQYAAVGAALGRRGGNGRSTSGSSPAVGVRGLSAQKTSQVSAAKGTIPGAGQLQLPLL